MAAVAVAGVTEGSGPLLLHVNAAAEEEGGGSAGKSRSTSENEMSGRPWFLFSSSPLKQDLNADHQQ